MNLTAIPSGSSRTTRPMQAPTASGMPTGGCTAADTATPEAETSMMKQGWVDPSASVSMECGCGGTMRAGFFGGGGEEGEKGRRDYFLFSGGRGRPPRGGAPADWEPGGL